MLQLPHVTLIGADCVNADRLLQAAAICQREIQFGAVKILTSIPHDHPDIVPIAPIRSREEYSSFVVKQLNSYIDTPFALVILLSTVLKAFKTSDETFSARSAVSTRYIMLIIFCLGSLGKDMG